jgi:hypothetical protein
MRRFRFIAILGFQRASFRSERLHRPLGASKAGADGLQFRDVDVPVVVPVYL